MYQWRTGYFTFILELYHVPLAHRLFHFMLVLYYVPVAHRLFHLDVSVILCTRGTAGYFTFILVLYYVPEALQVISPLY